MSGVIKAHFILKASYLAVYDALPNVRRLTYRLMAEKGGAAGHCNVGNLKLWLEMFRLRNEMRKANEQFFENTRKPMGNSGRLLTIMMNRGHAAMAKWGLSHIVLDKSGHVLDVGCGGGANLVRLLALCPDVL